MNKAVTEFIDAHWTVVIFLPAVLAVIFTLALITRWWDIREAAAQKQQQSPQ